MYQAVFYGLGRWKMTFSWFMWLMWKDDIVVSVGAPEHASACWVTPWNFAVQWDGTDRIQNCNLQASAKMYENVNIARDGLALEMLGPCGIWVVTFWLHGWKTRYVYMMFPYVPIKSSMDVTGNSGKSQVTFHVWLPLTPGHQHLCQLIILASWFLCSLAILGSSSRLQRLRSVRNPCYGRVLKFPKTGFTILLACIPFFCWLNHIEYSLLLLDAAGFTVLWENLQESLYIQATVDLSMILPQTSPLMPKSINLCCFRLDIRSLISLQPIAVTFPELSSLQSSKALLSFFTTHCWWRSLDHANPHFRWLSPC